MRGALQRRVHTEVTPSRTGTHCSHNPMFLSEKGDATLTASREVLGVQTWGICPDSRPCWTHSPSQKLLNQPATNKREPGLLEMLPTRFSAYLGHVYCHCLCCTKEAQEMRVGQDGCTALTQYLPRFLGWVAERLSRA